MTLGAFVAPMIDWTDRHCRAFHRVISRRARLYTEMITTGAVIHGDRARILGFDAAEHPVAVQLGGCEPAALAQSACICEAEGYAEINLNVGCPSDRVQDGRFGACLMRTPALVGDCVAAMSAAVSIPVTVKCRIGVDDQDPEQALDELADAVVAAGAQALFVHARKAWLQGLSPKENRDIPPLDYARVLRLKARLPHLPVVLNGGLGSLEAGRRAHAAARRHDAGPRRLSGSGAADRRRSAPVRGARARCRRVRGRRGLHPLCGSPARRWVPPPLDDTPHAGAFPGGPVRGPGGGTSRRKR